jgi:hypothetical protein
MMSVKILGFGSSWWTRFGRNPEDPWRFTRHAAYYNSAGVRCGNKVRRHWIVPGLVRFNGFGDFNPHFATRSIGGIFQCTDPVFAYGGNRVLLAARAPTAEVPDWYLVVISSELHGNVDFADPESKSETTLPVAVSQLRGQQEALMLMEPGDWIRSSLGIWQLGGSAKLPNGSSLRLVDGAVSS